MGLMEREASWTLRHPRDLAGAQLVADPAHVGRNVRRSADIHPRGRRRPAREVRQAIRGIPEDGNDKIIMTQTLSRS